MIIDIVRSALVCTCELGECPPPAAAANVTVLLEADAAGFAALIEERLALAN